MAQQFRPYLTEEEEAQIRASETTPIYTPGEGLLNLPLKKKRGFGVVLKIALLRS
jgi:hypothetical protein